jgi:hypothetical protein
MNNTLHTPAPWKPDLVSLRIWANDGNIEIARTSSDVGIQEEEANTRLISAAPDLLSALKFLLADYIAIDGERLTGSDAPLKTALSAIAKAGGYEK